MDRRQFLDSSCRLCLLAASGFLLAESVACDPAYQVIRTEIMDDLIRVPLSVFDKPGLKLVRPAGWVYDIAVRKDEQKYEALLLRCTHQNNQLIPAGKGYLCILHGSTFDQHGNATKGPAELSLLSFRTSVIANELLIHLRGSAL